MLWGVLISTSKNYFYFYDFNGYGRIFGYDYKLTILVIGEYYGKYDYKLAILNFYSYNYKLLANKLGGFD